MSTTRRLILGAALAVASLLPARAAEQLNLYTTREPGLIQPLLQRFTQETGVAVSTVFLRQGLAERVQAEGAASPADLVILVDVADLVDFTKRELAQPLNVPAVEQAVPAPLRDSAGQWTALTMRARAILVSKDRVPDPTLTYESLADPRWRGRVCMRSGQHPYNTSLFGAFLAHRGEAATLSYLQGVRDNLARRAAGGDREVARDILAGTCDIGLANTYYVGLMLSGRGGPEQQAWGQAVRAILPTFEDGSGSHVNISGAAIARHAPNAANARRLLAWLVGAEAQQKLAEVNFEYPVRPGVAVDPIIANLGALRFDTLPLERIAGRRAEASLLVDRVGFDR